ncbi:MAG: dephospho-CoA kinase [Chlorobi bacterium]|nr:dephospho-CoA kinase [Chlorobiota bacterium]
MLVSPERLPDEDVFVVCITGLMGSGKSTAARILRDRFGIPVYDADTRAKVLMNEEPLRTRIKEAFGDSAYEGGELNTGYLASRVFGEPAELARLEALVHPAVREDLDRWLAAPQDAPYVAVENALLFKTGMDRKCDLILVITAPEDVLVERVKARNGWSETHIRQRLDRQRESMNVKKGRKDVIFIRNDKDYTRLLNKIKEIHRKIINRQIK